MPKEETKTSHRRKIKGTVISDKMDKTIVIKLVRFKRHPKYHKVYKVSKKFKIHDAKNEAKIGDEIIAESCRPISRDKYFNLIKIIKKES